MILQELQNPQILSFNELQKMQTEDEAIFLLLQFLPICVKN